MRIIKSFKHLSISSTLEESDVDEIGAEEPNAIEALLRKLRIFMLQSVAYSDFRISLLRSVHQAYENRILQTLGSDLISDRGQKLDNVAIRDLASELSWVPGGFMNVGDSRKLSLADCAKGCIEDTMGETWQWWTPRRFPLKPGYKRLS
jgi:hypothetical protein